jgi:hypothetical protein
MTTGTRRRIHTWENHGLDPGQEENIHGTKALATHDVHLPAEEDLSSNETSPDERPRTDRNHVTDQGWMDVSDSVQIIECTMTYWLAQST